MPTKSNLLSPGRPGTARDLGLAALRVGLGFAMIYGHGWGKLSRLLAGDLGFPDPLGLGGEVTFVLAVFAEFLCALLVAIGLFGRLATLPLIATMGVAFFVQHAGDPFGVRETALLYLVSYVGLLLTGPGRYSLDAMLHRR